VGEDQVSHVELSREIVRRFNSFYGFSIDRALFEPQNASLLRMVHQELRPILIYMTQNANDLDLADEIALLPEVARKDARDIGFDNFRNQMGEAARFFRGPECLTEPGVMLTETPRIPGLDGRKMSKSYGNAITLSETDEEIRKKTKVMVTDPARKRRTDPGNPDVCPVYDWHKLFSAQEPGRLEWVRQGCTTAGIGCIECKAAMADNLIKWIGPKREQRIKWENDPKGVLEIIDDGSKKARVEAKKTMERVREAVFHWKDKRREIGGTAEGPK